MTRQGRKLKLGPVYVNSHINQLFFIFFLIIVTLPVKSLDILMTVVIAVSH